MKKLVAYLGTFATTGVILMAAFVAPAFANPPHQICDSNSECLNNWNAANQYVKDYHTGADNNYFTRPLIQKCYIPSINQYVNTVQDGRIDNVWCPFANHDLDTFLAGDLIVAIQDQHSGLCVGDDQAQDGLAYETGCPNFSNGSGGGFGTVFVKEADGAGGCQSGYSGYDNRKWSDFYDLAAGVTTGTSTNGATVGINATTRTCLLAA